MQTMFRRLTTPVSEATKLRIMMRNINPYFQQLLALTDIDSVEDLLKLSRRLEHRRAAINAYVPPSRNHRALEPDLAYVGSSTQDTYSDVTLPLTSTTNFVSPVPQYNTVLELWKSWPPFGSVSSSTQPPLLPVWKATGHCQNMPGLQSGGKRHKQTLDDRLVSVTPNPVIDFILSHARGDKRPYLTVSVLNREILGLLDSGACCTVVGEPGWKLLQSMGFSLNKTKSISLTVADGKSHTSIGSISVPFRLQNLVRWIEVVVMPAMPHTLILGIDFFKEMGVVPDLRSGEWIFTDVNSMLCRAAEGAIQTRQDLSEEQSSALDKVIKLADRDGDGDLESSCTLREIPSGLTERVGNGALVSQNNFGRGVS
ncbi:hypothetical protein CBL_20077 [Carabus blaptoides fortunei]